MEDALEHNQVSMGSERLIALLKMLFVAMGQSGCAVYSLASA